MAEWGVIPSIRVQSMRDALRFYVETLEFDVKSGGEDASNSSLDRGTAHVMVETAAHHFGKEYNAAIKKRLGTPSTIALYIEADDLEAFYPRLEAGGVARIIDSLAARPWGQQEFTVEDQDGNWLTFWKK